MTTGPVNGREPTPRERLRGAREVLSKRRGLVTKVVALILFAIALATWLMTPMYRADSSLYVRLEQEPADAALPGESHASRLGSVSPLAVLNSYVETLLSRSTAEQIVREFKLDQRPQPTKLRDRIKTWVSDQIGSAFKVATRFLSSNAGSGGEDKFRRAVDDLRSDVAAEVDQDTELVLVTVLYDNPSLAKKINQRMLDILSERSVHMSRADAASAYRAAVASLPTASARLKTADRALADFKRRHGIVTLSEEQRVRIQRLDTIESQHDQANTEYEEGKARLEVLRKEFKSRQQPITVTTTIEDNPQVRQAKADLYTKEGQLAGMLQTYTEDHPDVVRLRSQIKAAQDRLRAEVARVVGVETKGLSPEYSGLVQNLIDVEAGQMGQAAKEKATRQVRDRFRGEMRALPATERDLDELVREQKVAEDFYSTLSRRIQQLQASSAFTTPPVSMIVVDPPRLPHGVKDIGSPPYVIITILAPVLALLLGFTAAFVAEYFDDTLGSEREVSDLLALPVLASVPYTGKVRRDASTPGEG